MASRSPDMMAALRRLKAETERLDVFLTSEWVASEENSSPSTLPKTKGKADSAKKK